MRFYEIAVTESGQSTFPTRFPLKALPELKKSLGNYIFSCQFMLQPVPPEDQVFLMDWIQYWDKLPKFLKIVICMDPATERRKKENDYTAFTVHGWDDKQNWYILEIYRDKLMESQMMHTLMALHKKWQKFAQNKIPALIETIGFQLILKSNLERTMRDQNYSFKIVEMGGGVFSTTSKHDRIRAVQPYFERGEVFIPRVSEKWSHIEHQRIDFVEEFLMEYGHFPRSVHDDMLDTLAFPIYWDGFKSIRASEKREEQLIPDNCMARIKENIEDHYNLRHNPSNVGFSDTELWQHIHKRLNAL